MTDPEGQDRPTAPVVGDELATLLGFLDFHRATLAWKTSGLDAAGLRATTGASTMTLAGLLKHLAWVEDYWFGSRLLGRPAAEPWASAPWADDSDWEWTSAAADDPDQLRSLWAASVARSRDDLARALADGGLDRVSAPSDHDPRLVSLRWILVHMIEEYARHNGHADLLREAVDGQRGA